MEIISRQEALDRGFSRYFTGVPCIHGHVAERYTANTKCLECNRQSGRERYKNNPLQKQSNDRWRAKNKERKNAHDRARYQANKDRIRAKIRANWGDEDRRKQREWRAKKIAADPVFAISCRMRSYIATTVRNRGEIKNAKTIQAMGCDFNELKAHLEKQFLPGMSWENRDMWHIDHIVPLATAQTEQEVLALFHFTNMRPMWAKENISKSKKITHLI